MAVVTPGGVRSVGVEVLPGDVPLTPVSRISTQTADRFRTLIKDAYRSHKAVTSDFLRQVAGALFDEARTRRQSEPAIASEFDALRVPIQNMADRGYEYGFNDIQIAGKALSGNGYNEGVRQKYDKGMTREQLADYISKMAANVAAEDGATKELDHLLRIAEWIGDDAKESAMLFERAKSWVGMARHMDDHKLQEARLHLENFENAPRPANELNRKG